LLHTFGILKDVVIPKANDLPPTQFKPSGSAAIVVAIGVLPSIGFDDKASSHADEIDDERTETVLAPEFMTGEPPVTEDRPGPTLGIGHRAAIHARGRRA
jgi:hypothetical protein